MWNRNGIFVKILKVSLVFKLQTAIGSGNILYSFKGNYLAYCKQCIWNTTFEFAVVLKPNPCIHIFKYYATFFISHLCIFTNLFCCTHKKPYTCPWKTLKSTQFKSLSQTSFFVCQEPGVSFLAANNYSVPVDKDINPCCSPFRFVFRNSMGILGENFPFGLSLEFPELTVQTSICLSYS